MIKELLYWIYDENGQTYDNDSQGNLITTPSPKPIENAPDGWQDTAIKFGRNENYYGIVRSYTVPLGFVRLGARIIRQLYYGVKGIQAIANLLITKYNHLTDTHDYLYHSAINFSTFSDTESEAEVQTTDGELSAMIAANEGTTYEISMEVPEALNVTMTPITLYSIVKAISYSYIGTFSQTHVFIGTTISNSETKYISLVWNDFTDYYSSNGFNGSSDQWLFMSNQQTSLRVQSSSFKLLIAGATSYRLVLYLSESNVELPIIPNTSIPGTPNFLDLSFDVSFDIPNNEVGYLVLVCGGTGAGYVVGFSNENDINFTYNYNHQTTVNKWLRPLYVFQQLISKISSGKYTGTSKYLELEAADFVIGCGDSVRGFKAGDSEGYEGPTIKTSLRDFFQSFNTFNPIGISIENNVAILEKRAQYYDSSGVSLSLGAVRDCTVTCATDYIPSSIQIGWPVQTYDDVNGREEFNTTHTYTTPITRQSKVLDLAAVYRADSYGIEFTRINLDSKTTTDSDSDSDVFILNIATASDGTFIINRPAGSSVSGVLGGLTTYNWLLSPKRCLLNHGAWLHGALDKQDDGFIAFSSSEKNQAFTSTINGVTVVEKSDILIGSLPPKIFLPHKFEFVCQTQYNAVDLMNNNPFKLIEFEWMGEIWNGFIIDAGQQPALNPEQTFTLLAGPGNNMLNMIK